MKKCAYPVSAYVLKFAHNFVTILPKNTSLLNISSFQTNATTLPPLQFYAFFNFHIPLNRNFRVRDSFYDL